MKQADFSPNSQALLLQLQKFPWTDFSRAGSDPCVLPGTEDGLQGWNSQVRSFRVAQRVEKSRPMLGS